MISRRITGALAWAGLVIVVAVPAADMVVSRLSSGTAATVSPADEAEPAVEIEEETILPDAGTEAVIDHDEEQDEDRRAPRWPLAVALIACAAWLAGMLWLAAPSLAAGLAPIALVEFIAALCIPLVLIGIVWLLSMRTSTAEARRFGRTAAAMRAEAASLERTIAVLSTHLDANREKLADQTTMLMAMGDTAAERLAAVRESMADEVARADMQARRLTDATNAAQSSLGVLLSSLPRAHSETAEMARTLASGALRCGQ